MASGNVARREMFMGPSPVDGVESVPVELGLSVISWQLDRRPSRVSTPPDPKARLPTQRLRAGGRIGYLVCDIVFSCRNQLRMMRTGHEPATRLSDMRLSDQLRTSLRPQS